MLSVGRPEARRFGPLYDDFAARVRTFGVEIESRWVAEVRAGGRYSDAHVREREAASLRGALPPRRHAIAVTPEGTPATTEQFAKRLTGWSTPVAVFLIGGPLGLDPAFVAEAEATLSLSKMTFPHDLARVMLAEQIYRAVTLLRRVPYHK